MPNENGKLIVAIETNTKMASRLKDAAKTIQALAVQGAYRAQPVSVVSPDQVAWPSEFSSSWLDEFRRSGEKALAKIAGKLGVRFSQRPEVLTQPYHSRKNSAKALTDFATDANAAMLVLITHVSRASEYLPFGGFAETTMMISGVPILALNAKAKPIAKVSALLFATEFSEQCERAFPTVLKIAKDLNCKVRLLSILPGPVGPIFASGSPFVMPPMEVAAFLQEREKVLRKKAEAWAKTARNEGVSVQMEFENGNGRVSDQILKAAQGKGNATSGAEVIVLSPQIGRFGAWIMGSTTREVLRKSKAPVLLIKTNQQSKENRDEKETRKQNRRIDDNKSDNDRRSRST